MGLLCSEFIGIGAKDMKFLVRKTGNSKSHLWNDGDTYCRMFSTNGLNKKKYHVVEKSNNDICHMCNNVYEEYAGVRFDIKIKPT